MIRILKSAIRHPIAFAMTLIWPDETRSDPERWVKSESLFPEWDERTALLAKWIENGSSVIEFGAARLTLPKYLGPDCSYQPVDMVRRSPECLVFNLNGELPDLPRDYDVAVFSGVIEYVNSPGRVLDWLAPRVKQVVCSFAIVDWFPDPITRHRNGWIDLTDAQFRKLFTDRGFVLTDERRWRDQKLCNFVK